MLTLLLLLGFSPIQAGWLAIAFYAALFLLIWWGA